MCEGVDAAMEDVIYELDKIFVGRVFKSKAYCKIKISIHAINQKFHFRTTRSTSHFMVLQCVSRTCSWHKYAMKFDDYKNFQIRQATLKPRCTVDDRRNYHKLVTTQVIRNAIKICGNKNGTKCSDYPEAAA